MTATATPDAETDPSSAPAKTDEPAAELFSEAFNVVVVPTSAPGPAQTFILSAMRRDRALRLVSPDWTELEVRAAFTAAGCSLLQTENLLRGNRMAYGGRRTDYLYFYETQLRGIGLAPEPEREATPDLPSLADLDE